MKTSSGIAVLLLAILAVEAVQVRADISCPDVLNDLEPCLPFLQGNAPDPSNQCCDGVRALYAAADTRPARQATCRCLKSAYLQVHAQLSAAQELPGDCGVPLSYKITPDINCDQRLWQSNQTLQAKLTTDADDDQCPTSILRCTELLE